MGTTLYVIDGPVAGSGYDWWRVALVDEVLIDGPVFGWVYDAPAYGWVAGADLDGAPWIGGSDFVCPDPPTDFASLVKVSEGVALGCFSRQPITVRARVVEPGIGIDGPGLRPQWFAWGNGPIFLVDPQAATTLFSDKVAKGICDAACLMLHLDPAAGIDPIPVDKVVDATGMFDHPAARYCQEPSATVPADFADETVWAPSIACRFAFAVTGLTVVGR